jgi:hypothetical protein
MVEGGFKEVYLWSDSAVASIVLRLCAGVALGVVAGWGFFAWVDSWADDPLDQGEYWLGTALLGALLGFLVGRPWWIGALAGLALAVTQVELLADEAVEAASPFGPVGAIMYAFFSPVVITSAALASRANPWFANEGRNASG